MVPRAQKEIMARSQINLSKNTEHEMFLQEILTQVTSTSADRKGPVIDMFGTCIVLDFDASHAKKSK